MLTSKSSPKKVNVLLQEFGEFKSLLSDNNGPIILHNKKTHSIRDYIKPIRVLCLDGGGMRGLIEIAMLKEMEKTTGKTIQELFDVVAGTSTGALLAFGIVFKKTEASEAEAMYRNLGKKLFPSKGRIAKAKSLYNLVSNDNARYYDSNELENVLRNEFGDIPVYGEGNPNPKLKTFCNATEVTLGNVLIRNYFSNDTLPTLKKFCGGCSPLFFCCPLLF